MQLGDARKLDQKTQEALRLRAVLLVEKGATHMEAALAVGVHRGTVSRWCGTYRRDGASGLEKGKRGRRAGDQLMLTAVEARRVQRWIRDKMPDQMKCKGLDLIHRSMSDCAIHLMGRALSARRCRFCQGRELRSRRRSRCSASLTESIRSPNSPPRDEWQVAISRGSD